MPVSDGVSGVSGVNGVTARSVADVVGVVGSALCALHCMIVPLSLVVGPMGPLALVEDEIFHRVMLWVVVPAAALAFSTGCLQHRDRRVSWMGGIGVVCLTASFTVLHDLLGENGERIVATASAGLLIAAHVRNFRLCRAGACAHEPAAS